MKRARAKLAACLIAAGAWFCAVPAFAQAPESRPLLERLNVEVQSLYTQVQQGVVKVQMPPQRWAAELVEVPSPLDDPKLRKDLSKEMIAALESQRAAAKQGVFHPFKVSVSSSTQTAGTSKSPATGPAKAPPSWEMSKSPDGKETIFTSKGGGQEIRLTTGGERGPNGEIVAGPPRMAFAAANDFAPNNLGLLLDDRGHFLVPSYVEKDSIGPDGIKVAIGDQRATARFVGSDKQSQLTILKLDKVIGRPMALAQDRPTAGSLVLLMAPNSGTGKLIVWTQNTQDYGVVANIDGTIAGFVRYGRFFTARAARPVIDQLVRTGSVRRAPLGVGVAEVQADDPVRQINPILADRPALRVDEVTPGSSADRHLLVGDLICAIGDEPVGDPPTFAAFLSACSGTTALQIIRGGQAETITVELKAPATAPSTRP